MAVVLLTIFSLSNLATATSSASSSEATNEQGVITRTTVVDNSTMEISVWEWSINGEGQVALQYFALLSVTAALLSLVTIFLYRRRLVQIRLCYVLWVMNVGLMVFQWLYYSRLKEACESQAAMDWIIAPSLVNVFPLISLILVWLAYRGIIADEALVRSADRLR